ncbi:hypothetical protein HanHA300_Chr14g0516821 [Helianthus annuus]|nr:hypothetical protein HanHA300_Chr14g0516821 [Helianthus annuus]KAJ0467659.1 hypothetical protein HanIR_Chr14g0687741 [Helianthus annuus]
MIINCWEDDDDDCSSIVPSKCRKAYVSDVEKVQVTGEEMGIDDVDGMALRLHAKCSVFEILPE